MNGKRFKIGLRGQATDHFLGRNAQYSIWDIPKAKGEEMAGRHGERGGWSETVILTADAGQIHPTNQEEPRKSDLAKICQSWEGSCITTANLSNTKPFKPSQI